MCVCVCVCVERERERNFMVRNIYTECTCELPNAPPETRIGFEKSPIG